MNREEGGEKDGRQGVAFTTALSLIMSWLAAKNKFGLVSATAFHFSVNLFARLFLFGRINWLAFAILTGLLVVAAIALILCDRKTFAGIVAFKE